MKLIRKLDTRINKNGIRESWAVFWCDFCNREVEKRISGGKRDKSCGCNRYEFLKENDLGYLHGCSRDRLYKIFDGMKSRCTNSNHEAYPNYGGRGITICPEWTNDYTAFRDWALSNGYQEGLTIHRENPNGNYEPYNCQWVSKEENSRKKRINKIKDIEKANEIRDLYAIGNYTQKELAIKYDVSNSTINNIIKNKRWG